MPEEVRKDDSRLTMYALSFVWRAQVCGDPVCGVLRMCEVFRSLPLSQKRLVFRYWLKAGGLVVRELPLVHNIDAPVVLDDEGAPASEDENGL